MNGQSKPKGTSSGLRTWIEVDNKAIAHNFALFRSIVGKKVKIMSVVKSNAYGHDLVRFAQEQERLGTDWMGVDSIVEGVALRKAGIQTPILVLGYILPERLEDAAENNISVSLSSIEHIDALSALSAGKKLKVHLKVDTGMHRQGFLLSDMESVLRALETENFEKHAVLEGVFTHFASAKNPAFPAYTNAQISEFTKWTSALTQKGFSFIAHAAATGGTLLFPDAHFDMVRIGIGLYGLWPSSETEAALKEKYTLKPVLSWKTVIGSVKKLPKGAKIGYDGTEVLDKESLVAVCPVGYWHGFSRRLSSVARVEVRGKQCRVLGRVSMDMISIDVTEVRGVTVGGEVALINEHFSAGMMASLDETTHYETVTRLNPLIRRIYR